MRGQGDGVTGLPLGEFLEHAADHRLHRPQHIVLLDEAHLDVELVELARQAVGARILVAEARRDLEVAIEAGHHQELLVLLRRLRQGVELAGVNARRHQEVARAFGARGGEDRRLELEETLALHAPAHRIDDPAAQHDVGVQLFAPQVEEAVLEPGVLGVRQVAEDRQRQLAGRPEHFDVAHVNLDQAGRHVGIFGALGALADLAVDPHDVFGAQLFGLLEGGRIRIDHALGDAVMVAKIDEQHAAVVADAMAPARQADRLPRSLVIRMRTNQ